MKTKASVYVFIFGIDVELVFHVFDSPFSALGGGVEWSEVDVLNGIKGGREGI